MNIVKKPNKLHIALAVLVTLVIIASTIMIYGQAQQAPPRQDTVIISTQWGTPSGFNILIPNYAAGSNYLMYPALFVYGPYSDDFVPYLADSWRWVDPLTLEIKIKPDAYWWDGQPITADDVKWSFDVNKLCSTSFSYIWNYLSSVDVVDSTTVRFKLNPNNVNYFRITDILTVFVLPKHRWEQLYSQMGCKIATDFKDDDPSQIVGGGPYKLYYYTANSWTFIRVDLLGIKWWGEKYFGYPAPKFVMHITPQSDEQVRLAWINGERDQMSHFVDRLWEIIQQNPKRGTFDNHNCPPCFFGGSVVFFAFNLNKYPFNDVRVRKALYYALLANNMEALKQISLNAYSGYLLPPKLYPVPIIPGIERTEHYLAKDLVDAFMANATLDNAKKLLDEAGIKDINGDGIRELPNGQPFSFTIYAVTGWVPVIASAQMIAQYWRNTLGVDANVQTLDFSALWNKIVQGDFDSAWWMHSTRLGPASPWVNFDVAMDSRLPRQPWTGPISGYNNSQVNAILDEIGRTFDDAKRVQLFRQLQEIWLRDLPFLILGQDPHWYEYSEDYWVGWPNTDRIAKYGSFYATTWDPGFLFVLYELKPASQVTSPDIDTVPAFLKPQNRIPVAKFFADLQAVATQTTTSATSPTTSPTAPTQAVTVTIPYTVTATATVTSVATVTTTSVSVSTSTVEVTNWTITAALAIALLIIGFAIGWLIKRK
ncbi:MAG: ABC transporter substrate-binding protein [Ignisphaera sp.]